MHSRLWHGRSLPLVSLVILRSLLLAGSAWAAEIPVPLVANPAESLGFLSRAMSAGRARARCFDDPEHEARGTLLTGRTERLPAGRYRLHVPLALSPVRDPLVARIAIEIEADKAFRKVTEHHFPGEGSFTDMTLDFVSPGGVTAVRVGWSGAQERVRVAPVVPLDDVKDVHAAGDGTTTAADGTIAVADLPRLRYYVAAVGMHLEPLSPVMVAGVAVDKILYPPNATATAAVTVRNCLAEPQQVLVRCWEVTGLDDRRLVGEQPVEVAGSAEKTLTVRYPVGPVEYGRELLVEVVRNDVVHDSRGEPYGVADTLWKVALGSPSGGPIHNSANYTEAQIVAQLREARQACCNWYEKSFWAPDDWGVLTTPPGATWFSGQARRHENTEKLQFQIQAAHDLGMKAISYGKNMAGGRPGWELARKRPQWFSVDPYGRTMGRPADVWDLDHWDEGYETNRYSDYRYIWTYRWVDLRRLDALDHGIDQLIGSARQFGWDGVRFDSGGFRAHFVPKDGEVRFDGIDSCNARNMRRLKERLWHARPGFLFGYNTNDPVAQAMGDGITALTPANAAGHEFREMLAGGGLWMFEGIREKPLFSGRRRYERWHDYATDMVQAIRTIKGYGGHVCFSYGEPSLYKFVIGSMIGAHDYAGETQRAPGSEHWGRFLTRWSGLLWDHRLRALPDETSVTVTSERPVWWREFANELVASPTNRYVILHLMNPPVNDEVLKTKDEVPDPISGVTVRFAHERERLVSAMFIAPGMPNRVEPLTVLGDEAGISQFTLPRLDIWGMAVLKLEGTYEPARTPPALTEPLSAAELAEIEQCKHLFNVPTADALQNPTPCFDSKKTPPKDFGAAKVTVPAGLRVGGEPGADVLVVKGFYHDSYRIPEALKLAAPQARVTECTTRDLPKDPSDLFRHDVIVLVNMGADAWNADGHQRLAEHVNAGGRLVVLGGPFTLGQGFFKGTALEGVLPVSVRQARDVYVAPTPLTLAEERGKPLDGAPLLYYFHAAQPRPGATPRLWAGELPVAWEMRVGNGTSTVFLGTTMGEPQSRGETPFWEWKGWAPLAARILLRPDAASADR